MTSERDNFVTCRNRLRKIEVAAQQLLDFAYTCVHEESALHVELSDLQKLEYALSGNETFVMPRARLWYEWNPIRGGWDLPPELHPVAVTTDTKEVYCDWIVESYGAKYWQYGAEQGYRVVAYAELPPAWDGDIVRRISLTAEQLEQARQRASRNSKHWPKWPNS